MAMYGANYGANYQRPIVQQGSSIQGISQEQVELKSFLIKIPVRGSFSETKTLKMRAAFSETIPIPVRAAISTKMAMPMRAAYAILFPQRLIGNFATTLLMSLRGNQSKTESVRLGGSQRQKIQDLQELVKTANMADGLDRRGNLRTLSFEFHEVIGAAGPEVIPSIFATFLQALTSLATALGTSTTIGEPFDMSDQGGGRPRDKAEREVSFEHPSSFVGRVTYTIDLQTMEIVLNDRIYHYCSVPQRIYDEFEGAPSKGQFYNRSVKGQFSC